MNCQKCTHRGHEESDCPGQVNFALGQVKMEVWLASEISLSKLISDDFPIKNNFQTSE